MERRDLILLAAAAITTQPLTPQQLQYTMFLITMPNVKGLPDKLYTFKAYDHGPHNSEEIHKDVETLANQGLIFKVRHPEGWDNIAPSPKGMEETKSLTAELPPPTVGYISDVVQWAQENSFSQNLYAICKAFPGYAVNSVLANHRPATQPV